MRNKLRDLRKRVAEGDHGFTLIELLVVVVIIGILIAIAIPIYLNYENGAKNASAQADVRNAITAVNQCEADNGGSMTGVGATGGTPAGTALQMTGCGSDATGPTSTVSSGNTVAFAQTTGGNYTLTGVQADGKTYVYASATSSWTVSG